MATTRRLADCPAVQLAFIAALSLAAYLRALGRYFVSEDFPILRILSEGSVWENARDQEHGA